MTTSSPLPVNDPQPAPPVSPSPAARAGGPGSRAILGALVVWATASLGLGGSGLLAVAPRPVIPLLIASPVAGWAVAYRRSEQVRSWALSLGVRGPVLFHLIRVAFGAAFLSLGAEGRLPWSFAGPAGWGDIVVGLLSPLAAWLSTSSDPRARRLVLAWNALALADIVMVVLNAQRLIVLEGDARMQAVLGALPFSMLPTLVVPLVMLTHGLVFAQMARRARG